MKSESATKAQINTKVNAELSTLFASVPGSQDVISRAAGVLVFPRAGFMVGGQHGGGALRVGSKSIGYYHTDRMTYDVRPGATEHSVAIAFMTEVSEPAQPASPQPLTPSTLVFVGTG